MPPVADRNDVVQAVAAVQRLDLFADPALAVEPDPQPLAHGARPAIATDQVGAADSRGLPVAGAQGRGHAVGVLLERDQFVAKAHVDQGVFLCDRLEKRLQGVLRDQLVGLEWQHAIVAACCLRAQFVHRRIRYTRQRRVDHGRDVVDVHRVGAGVARSANPLGNPHAPEDLHRACIAAFHLGHERRLVLALDQHAAHAAGTQIDRQRQADRTAVDNQNWDVQPGHYRTVKVLSADTASVSMAIKPRQNTRHWWRIDWEPATIVSC